MPKPNTSIVIQQEQHEPAKIINPSDGMSMTDWLLVILVITSFLSKVIPLVQTGEKIYNSIIYINKDELRMQLELQKLCDQLLAITYAQRVVIGLFHNGTQDALGFHEKKMSVYTESCTDHTSPIKATTQSVPIDCMLEEILLSDTEYYKTVVRSHLDTPCDLHMESLGITRKDFRTFKGVRKEIYGIINFHYTIEPEEHFLDNPQRRKQVQKITHRIQTILETIKSPDTPKWQRFVTGLVRNFTKD